MECHHIKVYTGGKISIPLDFRNKMHIQDGDELLVTFDHDKIVISTYDILLDKAQNLVRKNIKQRHLTQELQDLRTKESDELK
ncbi:hypothetical protein NOVO_02055 [Rickettsiales bacterium Ac37b]|nr:hypothetical protein NOVO_02055 [Rickettsiales bacterium Ac37b]